MMKSPPEAARSQPIDLQTERATRAFLAKIGGMYEVSAAFLFGSRARGDFRADSDADVAILIQGPHPGRMDAALQMADVAFDVMMETGVLIEAIPLWDDEWAHPERFANPALIENIRREGVRL